MPNRSSVVLAAGGNLGVVPEPEYYRVVSTGTDPIRVTTTLPPPDDSFELAGEGKTQTISAVRDFVLEATGPVIVADVQASQDAAGVPRGLPGGDPSLVYIPPIEQWRSDYVFLTPDKYAFDFVVLAAPVDASLFLDGLPVGAGVCDEAAIPPLTTTDGGIPETYRAVRCQLSFPRIDPDKAAPANVTSGAQSDGVHRLQADRPFGLVVYGFDSYVSYAYAGGTQLTQINVR
jgi:hypothetical protein